MADRLLRQLALVSETQVVRQKHISIVSAALQRQASRDLSQFWNITSKFIIIFQSLDDVPLGYWPIIVKDNMGSTPPAFILVERQPFALVTASQDINRWSLTASHEMIEMLVDPSGNRTIAGNSPKPDQRRALFLVEPADPSESAAFAYTVNGVLVSDFYTVRYFDPIAAPGVRYSFTEANRRPRSVLRGGYLSWLDVQPGFARWLCRFLVLEANFRSISMAYQV